MNARILLLFLVAVPLVAGCSPRRGGGGGDDDDFSAPGFGGLDIDGDGALTDDDLDPGGTAIFSVITLDGDTTELAQETTDAFIQAGDGNWYLTFEHDGAVMQISIGFWSANPDGWELVEGDGALSSAWGSSEELWLGSATVAGDMVITSTDGNKASGWMDGEVEASIYDMSESEIGSLVIEGLSFNEITVYGWD